MRGVFERERERVNTHLMRTKDTKLSKIKLRTTDPKLGAEKPLKKAKENPG